MREQQPARELRRALGATTRCSRSSARTSRASACCSRPTSTRIRSTCSTRGGVPPLQGAAPAQRHRSTAGTAPATASRTASRTCASRTACCRPGRSIVDEMANAAFWFGLMSARRDAVRRHPRGAWSSTTRRRTSSPPRGSASARTFGWIGEQGRAGARAAARRAAPAGAARPRAGQARLHRHRPLPRRPRRARRGRQERRQWLLDSCAATRDQGTRAERLARWSRRPCRGSATVRRCTRGRSPPSRRPAAGRRTTSRSGSS